MICELQTDFCVSPKTSCWQTHNGTESRSLVLYKTSVIQKGPLTNTRSLAFYTSVTRKKTRKKKEKKKERKKRKKNRWQTRSFTVYNISVNRKKPLMNTISCSTTPLSLKSPRWRTRSLAVCNISVTGKKAADEHDLLLSTTACFQRHSPRLRRLSRLCSPPLAVSPAWRHWGCCRHTWVWRCRSWCHWVASHPSVYWGRWTIHSRRDSQTWREGDHISGERNKWQRNKTKTPRSKNKTTTTSNNNTAGDRSLQRGQPSLRSAISKAVLTNR